MSTDKLSNQVKNSIQLWNSLLTNSKNSLFIDALVKKRIMVAKSWFTENANRYKEGVLSIGTGQGYLEREIIRESRFRDVGIVISDISLVGMKKLRNIKRLDAVASDITNLPFKNQNFGLIICMEVLEHLNKKIVSSAYVEMKRVTVDDARFIISVPVFEPISLIDHPVGHCRKYTIRQICKELSDYGFRILDKSELYAFESVNSMKSALACKYKLRRPNVVMLLCQKS